MKKLSLLLIPLLLSSCGISNNKLDKYLKDSNLERYKHWEPIDYSCQYLDNFAYCLFYYGNKNAVYDYEKDEYYLFKRPNPRIEDVLELTPGSDSFLDVIEKIGFPSMTGGSGIFYYCFEVEEYTIAMSFEYNLNKEDKLKYFSGSIKE